MPWIMKAVLIEVLAIAFDVRTAICFARSLAPNAPEMLEVLFEKVITIPGRNHKNTYSLIPFCKKLKRWAYPFGVAEVNPFKTREKVMQT